MTKERSKRKILVFISIILTAILFLSGCDNPLETLTGDGTSSGEVVELADSTPLPENGIITGDQFRSIEDKDRTVTFDGTASDGMHYTWTFNGKDIHNPQDQNLKIELTTEGLDAAKAAAGNATFGVGFKLENKGMICVPQLTFVFPQKQDVSKAMLIKMDNGQPVKISNVTFDPSSPTTSVTMNITQASGIFYLVGGNDAVSPSDVQDNTTDGSTGSSSGNTCTISISCATILSNMGNLTSGKEEFVPSDGWILPATTVTFNEGESVHDVLQRVCKENGIHMESSWTPAYGSAYVEGINQLYEFDCGQNSGWMYNVNGWFPNYGCSKYTVKSGDVISWVYTCNLGEDVGDNSMW